MAEVLIERLSFAAGEIGRKLRARSDLARYEIAVEQQENYITMVEGGAQRSPGTRFVLELKNQAQRGRLLPFRRSSTDYTMLVVNGGVSRFVQQGGFLENPDTTPFELTLPFAEADLAMLRAASTGNNIYAVDGTRYIKISRDPDDPLGWSYAAVQPTGGPVDTQNLDTAITIQASAATGTGITLTGVGHLFKAGQVGQPFRLDDRDLSLTAEWTALETGIGANAQRRWNGNVYQNMSGAAAAAGPNAPVHTEGDASAGQGFITWRFLHPGYGFARVTAFTNDNSVTATVLSRLPDTVVSGATYRWSPPAWDADVGFPTAIAFASPRLWLYRDDLFWTSVDSNPEDMTLTGDDDGAIEGRLRSPDGSLVDIQWALAAGALIVGTSDIEWVFRATTLFDPLTPKNLKPVPDNNDGSITQVAALVDGGVMFAGRSGKRLHYGSIDPLKQGAQRFDADEISVTARHIFSAGIVATAWQRDPHRVLWVVLGDGTMAAVTFMPKQQVIAFHRHPRTNAFFEDVAVIPAVAGGVDEVYFIVRRTIGGQTKRYVEQLAEFFNVADDDVVDATGAWFLDCALRYQGTPVSSLANLAHLEGQEIGVFAGGAMQGRKTVAGGTITLDRPASDILVGLPIVARIRDLPRNAKGPEGSTKAAEKTIREAVFDLSDCGGGKVRVIGRDYKGEIIEGEFEDIIRTGGKKYGGPIALFNGTKRIPIEGSYAPEVALEIVNDDAMPCSVTGMSPRLDVEETP